MSAMPWYAWVLIAALAAGMILALLIMIGRAIDLRDRNN